MSGCLFCCLSSTLVINCAQLAYVIVLGKEGEINLYYSELASKEIVNYYDGKKLGWAGVYDLIIDEETGRLESLVVERRSFLGMRGGDELVIPWSAIKRIGNDVIILDQPLD